MSQRAFTVTDKCPECDRGRLRVCRRRSDGEPFIGCSDYPRCRFVEAYDAYVQHLLKALEHAQAVGRISRWANPSRANLSTLEAKVKDLIFACHPDRNPGGLDGNRVVAVLNDLRSALKAAA